MGKTESSDTARINLSDGKEGKFIASVIDYSDKDSTKSNVSRRDSCSDQSSNCSSRSSKYSSKTRGSNRLYSAFNNRENNYSEEYKDANLDDGVRLGSNPTDEKCVQGNTSQWWQPYASLALSVHQTLVSVGEWAWNKTIESRVGGLAKTLQSRTSVVYESMKYRSSVAAQDCQDAASTLYEDLHGRLQVSRLQGSFERMLQKCARCKQNLELTILEARLRLNLATNRAQLRRETFQIDAKQKLFERYDDLVSSPLLSVRSRLKNAGSQTSGQMTKCKSRLSGNFKGNLNALSLKAKECDDDLENKFPLVTGLNGKQSEVIPRFA